MPPGTTRTSRRRTPDPPIERRPRRPEPRIVAIAASLLLAACATGSPRPPAGAAEAARDASTYSARLRVSLKGPELRARTPALLGFERPGSLRLEIPGPSGARLIAVARDGRLTAVFPGERAGYQGPATSGEMEALLGVSLTPAEVMDLLVGVPSPRLLRYRARWGRTLPSRVEATLPDGARLTVGIEEPEVGVRLSAKAFEEPAHAGFRRVDAAEARELW